jgi:hypothetical protein
MTGFWSLPDFCSDSSAGRVWLFMVLTDGCRWLAAGPFSADTPPVRP